MSYEAYRDISKNPFSYETWGEGTSLKQKESQNPAVILFYEKIEKVFDSTLVLNYLIFQKPEIVLSLLLLY